MERGTWGKWESMRACSIAERARVTSRMMTFALNRRRCTETSLRRRSWVLPRMGASLSRACSACADSLTERFRNERFNARQFARFRVKHHERYGQGAFGAIFLAHDLERDGQRVAAKRVRLWDNHSTREAMQREFDILMSLHHENIVQALTSCYHGDSFWLFMELLEGGELLELVLREGAVAEARAVGYMGRSCAASPTCTAAASCTRLGRGLGLGITNSPSPHPNPNPDLKLDNFVLTAEGALKIID